MRSIINTWFNETIAQAIVHPIFTKFSKSVESYIRIQFYYEHTIQTYPNVYFWEDIRNLITDPETKISTMILFVTIITQIDPRDLILSLAEMTYWYYK